MEEAERILSEGKKRNKQQSLAEKELQSEIPKLNGEDDFGWLKCNTDPRKTSLDIHITGTDDRNKSVDEDQGIGG